MLTIGIDEAGRGPVIGPLSVAGVSIDEETGKKYRLLGVKDSKLLSIRRIVLLEKVIKETADCYKVILLKPAEIDARFSNKTNLNYLELDHMIEIANALRGERVIVDSPSANTKKIKKYLEVGIRGKEIVAENYADANYVEVSAASILAKAERERQVKKIKGEVGYDFGSGYPSDPKTKEFLELIKSDLGLKAAVDKHLRKTWMTLRPENSRNLQDFA